ncbi:MAG TPA: DUF2510 domain-containing protein [Candidatus Nanopelagicales bacterium]|nr:DUF2510 domain-containing protein [Candidatus Nanopelagicales bacterium]
MFRRNRQQHYETVTTWQTGYPQQEVIGESRHAKELITIAKNHGGRGTGEVFTEALLIPEPNNPADRNAIKVVVEGQHVGYIPREDAGAYAAILTPLALEKRQILEVPTRVWWGADDRGNFMASVRLDLPPADQLWPINEPPAEPRVFLDRTNTYKVLDLNDEEHHAALAAVMQGRSEGVIYVTLQTVEVKGPRSTKQITEVHADGRKIGTLSKTATDTIGETLELAMGKPIAVYCLASVEMDARPPKVRVRVCSYDDLSDESTSALFAAVSHYLSTYQPPENRSEPEEVDPAPAAAEPAPGPVVATPAETPAAGHDAPPPPPPANWYPDPADPSQWRYWDGTQWTENYHRPDQ